MVVEGWLASAASARPGQVAVETPDGSLTYSELLGAASAGAQELAARGVQPGEPVAIALPAGLAFAQALHACLLLGAVAVPLDLRATAQERARIAAGARAVLEEPLAQGPPARGAGG
ncbi:MAG TPA: AMP-binding protein, partial [Solirubrobacteraceae bacterium]|nr:AMP-binding protein [Solirubrobacteraceae bacterium]